MILYIIMHEYFKLLLHYHIPTLFKKIQYLWSICASNYRLFFEFVLILNKYLILTEIMCEKRDMICFCCNGLIESYFIQNCSDDNKYYSEYNDRNCTEIRIERCNTFYLKCKKCKKHDVNCQKYPAPPNVIYIQRYNNFVAYDYLKPFFCC